MVLSWTVVGSGGAGADVAPPSTFTIEYDLARGVSSYDSGTLSRGRPLEKVEMESIKTRWPALKSMSRNDQEGWRAEVAGQRT